MSVQPNRSTGSHLQLANLSSTEESGEHHNEVVPYHSPSVSSESSFLVDKEASLYVRTWVQQNYTAERDHNVPRRDMFEHYKGACIAANLTPVNSATFGKLLRIVFPDLKTRRLGVRGQSKYHYCGIRLKSGEAEIALSNQPHVSTTTSNDLAMIVHQTHPPRENQQPSASSTSLAPLSLLYDHPSTSNTSNSSARTFHLPSFAIPIITSYRYSPNIDTTVASFTAFYETHCLELLKLVVTGQIEQQNKCSEAFYTTMPDQYKELIDTIPEVCDSIWRWDCTLYDTIIIEALPDIQSNVSPDMMRALRKYTQELVDHLKKCLVHYPEQLYRKKLDIARIFTAKLRRQLSLNQAAQTAASILTNPNYLAIMRSDWMHVDIDSVIDQTLWVSDYNATYINRLLRENVHELVYEKSHISHWIHWASDLVKSCLQDQVPSSSAHSERYLNYAKSVITKCNLFSSMILKDLGLRNSRSFSFFFSIKTFLDDYIMYLVEENIAQVNHTLVQTANMLPLPPDNFFANRSEGESSSV